MTKEKKLLRWMKAYRPLADGKKHHWPDGEWAQSAYGVYVIPERSGAGAYWRNGHADFIRKAIGNPFKPFWEATKEKNDGYASWFAKEYKNYFFHWSGRSAWEAEQHARLMAKLETEEERVCASAAQMLGDMFPFVKDYEEKAKNAKALAAALKQEQRRRQTILNRLIRNSGSKADWNAKAKAFAEDGWGAL